MRERHRPAIQAVLAAERQQAIDALSVERLATKIAALPGKPACIEVLWDGGTQGWFLVMSAVMRTDTGYATHHLGVFKDGGDIRLFNGQVPPWPEAVRADETGRALASRFGAAFHFPSPDKPELDPSTWLDAGGGTRGSR